MKRSIRKLLALFVAILCATSLATNCFAALHENGEILVRGDWETIVYDNQEFVRVPAPDFQVFGEDELLLTPYFKQGEVHYESESAMRYASVDATSISDDLIRINYTTAVGRTGALYFVRPEKVGQIQPFLERKGQEEVVIYQWNPDGAVTLSADDARWQAIMTPDNRVEGDDFPYQASELTVEAHAFGLVRDYGRILWLSDTQTDSRDYYLIAYDEYDTSYFYDPPNRLNFSGLWEDGLEVHAWRVTDPSLCALLDEMIESDNNWAVNEADYPLNLTMSVSFLRGLGVVFFGVIPLGVILFSLILWQKKKERYPFLGFAIKGLVTSQALLILSFIVFAVRVF